MKNTLSKKQIEKYSRQIVLKDIGVFGQKKILKSKVIIVGSGGLGCPVADSLCRAGVGTVGIVDNDKAVEIGKIVTADEALLINMQMFEQKGIPPKEKDEDDEETSEKIGLVGWVIKEVVKAEISKATADVEKYPNNIQTIIDCQVILMEKIMMFMLFLL